MKQLLLGDEAIALGAIHAGLSGVYAYPGTPSTEITEFIHFCGMSVLLGRIGLPRHLEGVVVRAGAEVMEGRDVEVHARLAVPCSMFSIYHVIC